MTDETPDPAPRTAGDVPAEAPPAELRPLPVPMRRIVEIGIAAWAVALVVVLVVPALHTGERSWWPWACACGIALGGLGWAYLRRGRGNARDAG